jgi:transcriptional regulator with XRE-family HTH domain
MVISTSPRIAQPHPKQSQNARRQPLRKLRSERKRRKWLQSDLAKAVGVTEVTVSRWETGEVFPQPLYCRKLCEVLGISLEDLFQEEPEELTADVSQIGASMVPLQANRLRQIRQHHRLSQAELAEAIGAERRSVNRWEHGQGTPNLPHLLKLCQVLGALPEDLFPDTSSKPSSLPLEEAEEVRTQISRTYSSGQRFFDY